MVGYCFGDGSEGTVFSTSNLTALAHRTMGTCPFGSLPAISSSRTVNDNSARLVETRISYFVPSNCSRPTVFLSSSGDLDKDAQRSSIHCRALSGSIDAVLLSNGIDFAIATGSPVADSRTALSSRICDFKYSTLACFPVKVMTSWEAGWKLGKNRTSTLTSDSLVVRACDGKSALNTRVRSTNGCSTGVGCGSWAALMRQRAENINPIVIV